MPITSRPVVLEIIGNSGAGKTTLIVRLIPELRQRGYRLAVVKHTSHRHELDTPGKDSHRLRKAGAEAVLVSSPAMFALFRDVVEELPLAEILAHLPLDLDLVLVEGYREHSHPALEIFRPPVSRALLANQKPNIIAVVSENPPPTTVPVFSPQAIAAITDFIEKSVLKK